MIQPFAEPRLLSSDLLMLDAALRSRQAIAVRRRILRQLIESLIYEGLLQPEVERDDDRSIFWLHGRTEDGAVVRYRCRGRRCLSFDRIRLTDEPVTRIVGDQSSEVESIGQFLLDVRSSLGADDERLARFIEELDQTLLKDAIAQYVRSQERESLHGRGGEDWEQAMPGHPYHPSYKSRIGFSYADNLTYGPEFGAALRPLWIAARRELTRATHSREIDLSSYLAEELGAELIERWNATIRERGCDPADYTLLPVHPWQWQHVAAAIQEDLRANRLILLGETEDCYTAQQSIRTLANRSQPQRAYLKLALSIVNTSTSRVLAPHTVQNAAPISDWLHTLVQGDAFLRDELRVILLREVLGVAYDPPRSELLPPLAGRIACIWRESLFPQLVPDESAVPFNALCVLDNDGSPLIAPWVERHGLEVWLRRLLDVSMLPIVHLLYAHGIGLESHAQNMILIHRDGLPQRIALKDFHDGLRFSAAHLADPSACPSLLNTPESHLRVNRNSYIQSDDPVEVRDFMHDAFFCINLGELALFLAERFDLPETSFWSLVHATIETYQRRFPQLEERFALFDLHAPLIQIEQLTKRRLYPDTEPRVHAVRNPLALSRAQARSR
ncbi:MAG TPA: IucA/IucC family protein [Herpetosiphonaceae bacterium]